MRVSVRSGAIPLPSDKTCFIPGRALPFSDAVPGLNGRAEDATDAPSAVGEVRGASASVRERRRERPPLKA